MAQPWFTTNTALDALNSINARSLKSFREVRVVGPDFMVWDNADEVRDRLQRIQSQHYADALGIESTADASREQMLSLIQAMQSDASVDDVLCACFGAPPADPPIYEFNSDRNMWPYVRAAIEAASMKVAA